MWLEVAVGSADHTTLVAAVKAGGLVETLSEQDRLPFHLQTLLLINYTKVRLKAY
jgi:hypothetical protein